MSNQTIEIAGDRYWAIFNVPKKVVRKIDCAQVIAIPVGAPYIYEAIRFLEKSKREEQKRNSPSDLMISPPAKALNSRNILLFKSENPFVTFDSADTVFARYGVCNFGDISSLGVRQNKSDVQHDLLRIATETERIKLTGIMVSGNRHKTTAKPTSDQATHVSWLGELVSHREGSAPTPTPCNVHVQVGLPTAVVGNSDLKPSALKTAKSGRILVLNLGELSDTHRIRKSQSYEAIAVDLLRYLRSDGELPNPDKHGLLSRLSLTGHEHDNTLLGWSILAVRLNNSAVFLYFWEQNIQKDQQPKEEAWIVCDKNRCAPIETPEVGKMLGFTGFVSSHFATVAADLANGLNFQNRVELAVNSVKCSLLLQRAAFERGLLTMLFHGENGEWKPDPNYPRFFDELDKHLRSLRELGKTEKSEILSIKIDIMRAVAHRTPWFMARAFVSDPPVHSGNLLDETELMEERFRELVLPWFTEPNANPEKSGLPIVKIGKLNLTDRREIEDYLAIHQALKLYSNSIKDAKPLNIAVFGAPGAGKSFGVKEVVKYIGDAGEGNFQRSELEFNLGQFKNLDDLPAALHLVRNECLSGQIPVVFFDEFDSSFGEQPFGWLKYLLAPMQDGKFYDNGQTYKIGKVVFIFAGGVNRSFEELNGRMRNPGFCQAKGPDFISRLKAHLNIQGMNKPEDDGDQGRYVLRRGVLIHSLVRQRLELKEHDKSLLLHRSVAKALLKVERFKHGVRSIESIIKMCAVRQGYPIGPSDLPSMEQLEMHVDASKLLDYIDSDSSKPSDEVLLAEKVDLSVDI